MDSFFLPSTPGVIQNALMISSRLRITVTLGLALVASLPSLGATLHRLQENDFGKTSEGTVVKIYTLRNTHNVEAKVMTLGATITQVMVPDTKGNLTNVVLGTDNFEQYSKGFVASASVIGRFANRIAKAKFTLDGQEFKLAANSGPNSIHGGRKGFASMNWTTSKTSETKNSASVEFTYVSKVSAADAAKISDPTDFKAPDPIKGNVPSHKELVKWFGEDKKPAGEQN